MQTGADTPVEPTGASARLGLPWTDFRRSADDRVVFGVCGGIARRFRFSSTVVRVGFVLLALTGIGAAVYALLAVATREDDDSRPVGFVRLVAGAVAAMAVLIASAAALRAAGMGDYTSGRRGSLLLILALATGGAALVAGRGADGVDRTRSMALPRPLPQPPVLSLLTIAAAAMAATGAWLATDGPQGEKAFGVILAAALIVVGLGVTVSAWRGRSFVLAPLGLALAVPLAIAAFADVGLTVGRDDPGIIAEGGDSTRTVVLGQGAGPVQVRKSAVNNGLRTLTIRKGVGRIEVRVDPAIPIRLEVRSAGGEITIRDDQHHVYDTYRTARQHNWLLGGIGLSQTATLTLRVETGFGSLLVDHSVPEVGPQPSLMAELQMQRELMVGDISARSRLLKANHKALLRLTSAYATALQRFRGDAVSIPPRVLRFGEGFWTRVDPVNARLKDADPVLAQIDRLASVRFNLLRAAWRVHFVERGLNAVKARLKELDRTIASTPKAGGS